MTIASDNGFKEGGIYVATGESRWFTEGSLVELQNDDGTDQPLFALIEGECHINNAIGFKPGAYEFLHRLRKPSFSEFFRGHGLRSSEQTANLTFQEIQEKGVETMTPSQRAGFSEDEVMILGENDYVETGTVAVLLSDDGTDMPMVKIMTGEHEGVSLWMPVAAFRKLELNNRLGTPADRAGLKVGDKVKVVTKRHGGTLRFRDEVSVGDTLTLSEDDGTDMPIFTMASGRIVCPKIENVVKLEDAPMTPAQEAGIEIGEKVVVNYDGHHAWNKGDIIEFIYDDGTGCPKFRGPRGTEHYIFVSDVRKQTDLEKGTGGQLIEVGEKVEVGDILILKDGRTAIVDSGGYPDSDGDYDTEERFINQNQVEAIYRKAKAAPTPEAEKVDLTIKVSEETNRKLAITGRLLEEHEISDDYSPEFKKAVVEAIHALADANS